MTERDDLHALTGAYAVGALEPLETAAFEAYLTESEEARMEVAELTETAVLLGMATRPITPPPALKSRIMAELLNTPQLASTPLSRMDAPAPALASVTSIIDATPNTPGPVVTPDLAPTADEHRRIRRLASESASPESTGPEAVSPEAASPEAARPGAAKASARWFSRPAGILVAAAAAVGLFFAGSAVGSGPGSQPLDTQAASFTELYAASDLERKVSTVTGGGEATLLWSDELERAAVVVRELPALGDDETYELWFIEDGAAAVAAGMFTASDSQSIVRVLDGELSTDAAVAITVEPAGGSEAPTTEPIVVLESA